ncbi:MAG: glycoside hydrolase family 92 protein, partial [Bacteroidaceae bacterium]|nr:glycoside hydrolase family 92 protein [Bacteroidaceae bacterium]
EVVSADISGMIGQYAHGNEPSHHIIHLYNYVGQPWRTQELVDEVLQTLYFNNPDGLSGNEDCGQMSAWYILNAMGFYQVCPGNPVYSIGRPLFKKATIHLPNGKDFVIEAINNSKTNKYVRTVNLNGKPIETPFFTHEQLMNGGTMTFQMTAARPQ